MNTIIGLIHFLARLAFVIILVDVLISYFVHPDHPVRRNLDRIVGPFLHPIQRIIPPIANIDFSPIILILLIQLAEYLLVLLLNSLR